MATAAANRSVPWWARDSAGDWPLVLSSGAALSHSMTERINDSNSSSSSISRSSGHIGNGNRGDDGGVGDDLAELSFVQLIEIHRAMLHNWSAYHTIDDPEFDLLRRPAWRGLMMALFITVILIGMIGNVIVVFIVARNRHMHNVTNVFIANLALSDIGLCVFSLPVQLYYQLTDHWIFGQVLCKLIFAAFAVPVYVSTLTILLIAFDRYWLIIYPLRNRMTIRTALILIGVNVATSAVLAAPVIWFTSLHVLDQPDLRIYRVYCMEWWPTERLRKAYSTGMFLLQFCLPLSMTALLYYKIYCRLKNRPASQRATTAVTSQAQERKQKTNKILFAIVSLFVVCWLPWNVFSLLTEIDHTIVKGSHFKFIDLLLKVFAMSSSCINPFLYCWLNDNFRKELDQMAIKMKLYRQERPTGSGARHAGSHQQTQPMMNGGGGIGGSRHTGTDLDNDRPVMTRAVTMDIIGEMSSSRMSITRMSTTRISVCSALDLVPPQVPSSRSNSTSPVPRGSVSSSVKYGNHLTVPV